jgi:hypothetical protein
MSFEGNITLMPPGVGQTSEQGEEDLSLSYACPGILGEMDAREDRQAVDRRQLFDDHRSSLFVESIAID